ncbi:MAG: hypothetical protein QG608_484 [Actinomycetota bacterium]|nr:hypothetical protein [Actinomycetota bacterium]
MARRTDRGAVVLEACDEEFWRPLTFHSRLILLLVPLCAILWLPGGCEFEDLAALVTVGAILLLLGLGKSLVWRRTTGKNVLVDSGESLIFIRWTGLHRKIPWADIDFIELNACPPRPERDLKSVFLIVRVMDTTGQWAGSGTEQNFGEVLVLGDGARRRIASFQKVCLSHAVEMLWFDNNADE